MNFLKMAIFTYKIIPVKYTVRPNDLKSSALGWFFELFHVVHSDFQYLWRFKSYSLTRLFEEIEPWE